MSMEHYRDTSFLAMSRLTKTGAAALMVIVCMKGPRTILQVERIQDATFNGKKEAEQHGIELCKLWIDKHRSRQ
jgi:hypothetical protein